MSAWAAYAAVTLLLVALVAGGATVALSGESVRAVWASAGLAWVLQLLAFAGLVAVRERAGLFLAGWLGGMGLRFAALGVVAWWASRTGVLPFQPLLISLVGFLFLLLLLEPVFMRRGLKAT
jgi:hypothetical protein